MHEALVYIKTNLIVTHDGMHSTIDSLIEVNDIESGSNKITLKKVNVKQSGFDKIYVDKEVIERRLYQIIDQFNERKITATKFYSILSINKIQPFYVEIVERVRYCLLLMI